MGYTHLPVKWNKHTSTNMKVLIISTLCALVAFSSARVISQDVWSQLGRHGLQNEPSVIVGQQSRIVVDPNVERVVPIVFGQVQDELPLGLRVENQQGVYQQVPVIQTVQPLDLERLSYNALQRSVRLNPFVPRYGRVYPQQVGVFDLQVPAKQRQWIPDYELGVLGQNLRYPQVLYGRNQGLLDNGRLSIQSEVRSFVPQTGRVQIGVQDKTSPVSVVQGGRIIPVGQVGLPISAFEQGRIIPQSIGVPLEVQGLTLRQYPRLYEVPQFGGVVPQVVSGVNGIPIVLQETQGQQVRVESVLRQEQGFPVQVEQVRVNPLGVQVSVGGVEQVPEVQQIRVRSEVSQGQGLPIQVSRVSPLGVQDILEEQNSIPVSEGVQQVRVRSEVRQEQQGLPVQIGRVVPVVVQGIPEELSQVPVVEQVRRSVPQGVKEILDEQFVQNQGLPLGAGTPRVYRPISNVDLPIYQTYGRGPLSRN